MTRQDQGGASNHGKTIIHLNVYGLARHTFSLEAASCAAAEQAICDQAE